MKKMRHIGVCLVLLSATLPGPSHANDGAAGLTGGTLVFKSLAGVSMDKEELHIAEHRVRVRYEFVNNTDRDITTLVAFPIEFPVLDGDTNFDPKDSNPLKFTVKVNGKSRAFKTRRKNGPKSDRVTLQHYWKQRFRRRAKTVIEHSYRPIFESGVTYMIETSAEEWDEIYGKALLKDYCASKAQLAWVKKRRLEFKDLTYILKTAATWDGPIKRFELNIYKGKRPRVFLCTDLKLAKVKKSNSFRATAKNYLPKSDLHIAYVGAYEQ